ncbi:site-2 protease family protein [Dactylosporangium sp. CA-092794]|uniref:site-2 protease family protein n=1 Tax=Dactylosporangium sp. CA-092794 TaxID=3239929 RepID=UPI003D90FB2A
MRQSLRLGTIAGIRIGLNWSVLLVMLLLAQILAFTVVPRATPGVPGAVAWLLGVAGAVVFLLSLLAHELAHSLVARVFGVPVERVTLWLLGGASELGGEPPTARADLLIAVAGPATSALLGVGFGGLALALGTVGAPAGVVAVSSWLAGINVLLAVFNLLPGAPLDGGRVLRAALWHWRGDRYWAAVTAARAGRAIGLGLIVLGAVQVVLTGMLGGLWFALIGWFLMAAATAEANTDRYRAMLGRVPVSAAMHTDVTYAEPDRSVAQAVADIYTAPGAVIALRTSDGRPAGLVRPMDLARVPEPARIDTPVSKVATPPPAVPVVEASQPLADVAYMVSRAGTTLVVDHGLLVGVLDPSDVAHATERSALHPPRPDDTRRPT